MQKKINNRERQFTIFLTLPIFIFRQTKPMKTNSGLTNYTQNDNIK